MRGRQRTRGLHERATTLHRTPVTYGKTASHHPVMHPRQRYRALAAVLALGLWAPATAFFVTIAVLVARETIMGRRNLPATIVDVRSALITAAYSLGGALIALGLAWLVLPRARGRALRWAAALWLGATALLLGTRQVGGWPLLLAALVAVGSGIDVNRRLFLALTATWRIEPNEDL